jgi:hypothetical protein
MVHEFNQRVAINTCASRQFDGLQAFLMLTTFDNHVHLRNEGYVLGQ